MAHETEIIVPGSFICLQGCPGDGLSNFMSGRLPKLPRDSTRTDQQPADCESDGGNEVVQSDGTPPPFGHLHSPSGTNMPRTSLGNELLHSENIAHSSLQPSSSANPLSPNNESTSVVTNDRQESRRPLLYSANDEKLIDEWVRKCREKEIEQRRDWRDSALQVEGRQGYSHCMMKIFEEKEMWWQVNGKLSVFCEVPRMIENGELSVDMVGTLSPGATVVATDIVFLDSISFRRLVVPPTALNVDNNVYPKPKRGCIQILQLDYDGRCCFTTLSIDGYWLLAPGLPAVYQQPAEWFWRVICPAGAFLREGLELNTRHIETIPYGSLVRVSRRTVNSQGLMRLRISAKVDDRQKNKQRWIDGWCSEYLNPQSGQRGIVLSPVPFPVPALYRVTLPIGAVIRSSIELSSPQIGVAPINAVLSVTNRAFSEHPVEKCIDRLELAGNAGWISLRLNRPPPNDDLVVELIGVDGNYDPDSPGVYHLEAQRRLRQYQQQESGDARTRDFEDLSSIESAESEPSYKLHIAGGNRGSGASRKCLICLTEDRNATIVHGETGHVACCLVCARILKARGDKCPVCRLNIDLVIQHFWA